MKCSSKTGLLASQVIKIQKADKNVKFDFEVSVVSAPFDSKPFARLCCPFAEGCSILCNHPAMHESKFNASTTKQNIDPVWKSVILPSEAATIRSEIEQFRQKRKSDIFLCTDQYLDSYNIEEIVSDELVRKYTETDSRPLTPAPTIASAHTRASAIRRCVTPDPIRPSEINHKTMLILDLRRSHSQETISCHGGINANETPLIRITNFELTPVSSRPSLHERKQHCIPNINNKLSPYEKPTFLKPMQTGMDLPTHTNNGSVIDKKTINKSKLIVSDLKEKEQDSDEEPYIKRRGRRRKKGRASSNTSIFHTSTDPETVIAGIGIDSKNPSARPSITVQDIEQLLQNQPITNRNFNCDKSFLDYDSLRTLRRELTTNIVDMEFDDCRKIALQEALKTLPHNQVICSELNTIHRETTLPEVDCVLRFNLPRIFSRSSVRFELPMDSRTFKEMTPMEYIYDNVYLTTATKLLYRYVFNLHRVKNDKDDAINANEETSPRNIDNEYKAIHGSEIVAALGTLMGKPFNTVQVEFFQSLVGWPIDKLHDFRMFSSICALCERILAKDFYSNIPGKKEDPCQIIETVDFESLEQKIRGKSMDTNLIKILQLIKIT